MLSQTDSSFTLDSAQALPVQPNRAYQIAVRLKVDLHTHALPELACFDSSGREIPTPSSLDSGPSTSTTAWQEFRRTFPPCPGATSVRARIRASGAGEIGVANLQFEPVTIDTFQTGALIRQIYPKLRYGLVLESNLHVVNQDLISRDDRDKDGRWSLIQTDLDQLTKQDQRGEDWRTNFAYKPNELYWSDGAVLKSDSALDDRSPDVTRALHFKAKAHTGPYRVILSDPGRAVALSVDGKTWQRIEGGKEVDLGQLTLKDGTLEFWLDTCYRDRVSAGPVYFDYVRLIPVDHSANAKRLFEAARRRPPQLTTGSVNEQQVPVTLDVAAARWPARISLPLPQGQLVDPSHATVRNGVGAMLPTQNKALARWPDGSIQWLLLDYITDGSKLYRVAYGNRIQQLPSGAEVQIWQTAQAIEVDTGSTLYQIPKDKFSLAVEVEETSGKRWQAAGLAVAKLTIEQPGPLHAIVRVETKLPASGKPAEGFCHRARFHFYAGSPLIQIDHHIANTDSRKKVMARAIRLNLPAANLPAFTSIQADEKAKAQGWFQSTQFGAGIQDFREQYPKAIRATGNGLQLDLWAPEGGDYEWFQSVGKTHRISLYYGDAGQQAPLLAHGPLFALAAPSWYAASGVFGAQVLANDGPLPAVEATLARHMDTAVIAKIGLGFENYGDHSSNGYVKGTYLWDNNEYDLPAAAMIHFARTGNREALRAGLAAALHYADVDVVHYSSERAEYAGAPFTHSHGTFGHHTAEAPGMSHAGYAQGLIWASQFTGDPEGLECARGIADWLVKTIRPERNLNTMERALGHPLNTLNDVYEATGEERYLEAAARLVDWAIQWEEPLRGGFPAVITEKPAYYSGSPFCSGLMYSGLMKFNSWAQRPEIDAVLDRTARWVLTDMWRPPAGIFNKGGGTPVPANISTHLRLLHDQYLRTKDPFFLAVPYGSVLAGYGKPDSSFGTRSTGLVFNYLPWYLTLLRSSGNPTPDAALAVEFAAKDLQVRKGQSLEVQVTVRNTGATPVSDWTASLQARLDWTLTQSASLPATLAAGQSITLTYQLRAPSLVNLTSSLNRDNYVHWSALYQRSGAAHLAHQWVKLTIHE